MILRRKKLIIIFGFIAIIIVGGLYLLRHQELWNSSIDEQNPWRGIEIEKIEENGFRLGTTYSYFSSHQYIPLTYLGKSGEIYVLQGSYGKLGVKDSFIVGFRNDLALKVRQEKVQKIIKEYDVVLDKPFSQPEEINTMYIFKITAKSPGNVFDIPKMIMRDNSVDFAHPSFYGGIRLD